MMTYVEEYRPVFMVVTFGLLGIAFYVTYRPRATPAGKSRFMTFNKFMLWGVTAFCIVMLFFSHTVMGLFSADNEVPADMVTADMERTELRIEGMT
jgi:hypothetical protein